MDYEGQKLAELLFYWIVLSFGAVGWVIGYFLHDFFIVFQAWFVGVVLSVIVSIMMLSENSGLLLLTPCGILSFHVALCP